MTHAVVESNSCGISVGLSCPSTRASCAVSRNARTARTSRFASCNACWSTSRVSLKPRIARESSSGVSANPSSPGRRVSNSPARLPLSTVDT
ncbi:hypothetical protein D9M71_422150 [compost metagenome]